MKNKKWNLWTGLISVAVVVLIGGIYALTRPPKMAQQETKKASTAQSGLKGSEKKVEAKKISKGSTPPSMSESTIEASQTEKSTAESQAQSSIADLKAFNQKAIAEEVYVKVPYGRTMNFERATSEKLKALEKQYTIKEMTNLRDDYDGQTKSVIIFE